MSIRKFRKNMKPIVWFITVAFLISLIVMYGANFVGGSNQNKIAFKLNGKEISNESVQREILQTRDAYTRYIKAVPDEKIIGTIAFNEIISKNLLLDQAENLKIKISGSEVKEHLNKIEAQLGSKVAFKNYIAQLGFTTNTFKKEIEENLLRRKFIEDLRNSIKITPEESKKYYLDYRQMAFANKNYDEVKGQVENILKDQKMAEKYLNVLANARKNMKLENLMNEYKEYQEKKEFSLNGIDITNLEYFQKVLATLQMTNGNLEEAKKMAKFELENEAKLVSLLKKEVEIPQILPLDMQLEIGTRETYNKFRKNITFTDTELQDYFNENRQNYNIQKSANVDLAVIEISKDEEAAKIKAEKILKEVTPENFAEKAKEYSMGPTAQNGGKLGTFTKGQMVKEFEEAVFKGEVGKIYPEVIKSQFGYHIIYVENKEGDKVTASHILIIPTPTEKTILETEKEVKSIVEDLNKKVVTFGELKKDERIVLEEKLDGITEDGYIEGLGYNAELVKQIFENEIGKISYVKENNLFFIFRKDSQIEPKEVTFEEVKSTVVDDYINKKAQEKLNILENQVVKQEL